MNKEVASNAVFTRVADMLDTLGFQLVDVKWNFGTMAEGVVRHSGRKVARLDFSAYDDTVRVLFHPTAAGNYQILAGSGRIHLDERLDKELDDVEAFFRTLLVKRGKLSYAEYPTDFALKGWLAAVSQVTVPRDPQQRKFTAESEVSIRTVELARRLAENYDRTAALRLHVIAAEFDVELDERGYYVDNGIGHIRDTALTCSDVRYGRHALAWKTGSSGSYLYQDRLPAPHRPALEVAIEEDLAPALAM